MRRAEAQRSQDEASPRLSSASFGYNGNNSGWTRHWKCRASTTKCFRHELRESESCCGTRAHHHQPRKGFVRSAWHFECREVETGARLATPGILTKRCAPGCCIPFSLDATPSHDR